MAKSYIYRVIGHDRYKVIRIDENKPRGDKDRFREYLVNLRNGDALCDCKGFYFTKRPCRHIKFILEQLKSGGGILEFQKIGDYDKLATHVRHNELSRRR